MFCPRCDDSLAGHRYTWKWGCRLSRGWWCLWPMIDNSVDTTILMMVLVWLDSSGHSCHIYIWIIFIEYRDSYNAKKKIILMMRRMINTSFKGTSFARIFPTASSATRMSLPTTAMSVEKSSASIQRSKQDNTQLVLQWTNRNVIEKQYYLQKSFPVD